MIAGAVNCLWGWGLTWWIPAYLMRMYHLSAGQAGGIMGPIHLYAGTGATLFMGWLVGRPLMRDSRRVARMLGWAVALATVPSIFIFWGHSLWLAKAMLWIFIPAIYFYIGPGFGMLNNLAPPLMRAQFCAVTLLVANVANLIIAPQLVGFLSDLFAPGHSGNAESLRWALLCLAPTGFWAALHYFWSLRTLEQDEVRALGAAT
jgi:hypothetical protein